MTGPTNQQDTRTQREPSKESKGLTRLRRASGLNGLTRTSVYRKIPLDIRQELDQALVLRADSGTTLDAIAKKFELAERFGITARALRSYARKLEAGIRPVMVEQLVASVLGCLPWSYKEQVASGSQILLLSRLVQMLHDETRPGLSANDLARLADIASGIAGRIATNSSHPRRSRSPAGRELSQDPPAECPTAPAKLAEAVRAIYGLSWPAQSQSAKPPNEPTARATDRGDRPQGVFVR
jgi:hypothetical protein